MRVAPIGATSSPTLTPCLPSSPSSHRRPVRPLVGASSTRLVVAIALLAVAAAVVLGALASSSAVLTACAAVLAVLAGAAATRITHSELMAARVEAAQDRAVQAQEYRAITERRTAESAAFAADMSRRIAHRPACEWLDADDRVDMGLGLTSARQLTAAFPLRVFQQLPP